ncbi:MULTISPECIES: hypothetical protein [Paraburkholderia]|uniref:hypothetical protein n=1 Tax=Paraburkholderia TaxID=1822464 RepID=UPI0022521B5A|nr:MULTISPECIES: hypothetical protein [Paraburkholderia]MCX4163588.1 hypothetical protein [Paraburkholderia megapolitana]MDN7159083.1 hypothetical protein [Paraburkholderia sp. CHISQ3]MDQ6496130.1 hypothetical protein [Paraburkholderia megapolitana]
MQNRRTAAASARAASQSKSSRENFRDLFRRAATCLVLLGVMLLLIPTTWRVVYAVTSLILLVVAFSIRTFQIFNPSSSTLTGLRDRVLTWYKSLDPHQQLYVNVVLCIPFLGYTYLLDARTLFPQLGILFFAYCLWVAGKDVYRIYVTLSGALIGKGLIAVAFAIGSNLAFSFAGWFIGELTHVPPSTFPHTLSFLAILAIPVLAMTVGAVFIPVSIVAVPLVIYLSGVMKQAPRFMKWFLGLNLEKSGHRYTVATLVFQLFFYSTLASVAPRVFFLVLNRFGPQIERTIGNSIYAFDMYPGTECRTASGYRQAPLGDENYVLATRQSGGVKFELPRKCAL